RQDVDKAASAEYLIEAALGYKNQLGACLAYVDAVEASVGGQASSSAAGSCVPTPVRLSVSGSGAATRVKVVAVGGASPLRPHCSTGVQGVSISLAPRASGTTLQSGTGPHVAVGVVRSRTAAAGGRVTVTFGSGATATTPPDLSGSWVNKATPTAGPPWQL